MMGSNTVKQCDKCYDRVKARKGVIGGGGVIILASAVR